MKCKSVCFPNTEGNCFLTDCLLANNAFKYTAEKISIFVNEKRGKKN